MTGSRQKTSASKLETMSVGGKDIDVEVNRYIIEKGGRMYELSVTTDDYRFNQKEAESMIPPKGCISIDVASGTIAYNTNEGFKEDLYENYGVYTSQKGLKSSGEHAINPNGKHTKITEKEYGALDPKDRSYHYLGDGLVVLVGCYYGDWRGLGVDAYVRSDDRLRVAWLRELGEAEQQKSAQPTSDKLRKEAEDELEELSKLVKPELIKAITEYIRKG